MAKPRLKIIPLGGLSEIGKNMMVMEYENDIIVIDAGTMLALCLICCLSLMYPFTPPS
jgi:mRNA degradation ribonuclease J1/J2